MSIKVDRIGSNLVKEISYILMTEVKNPDVRFVTVTDCKVTSDLSYAKVYVTVLNDKERESLNNQRTKLLNLFKSEFQKHNIDEIKKYIEILDTK